MKKVLSFSLWGNIRTYCIGAIKNAVLAKKLFPGWICRFYHDTSVPQRVLAKLRDMKNTELILKDYGNLAGRWKQGNASGMLWRFDVCIDPTVAGYIVCDTDSRVNRYLLETFNKMLQENKHFLSICDHPSGTYPLCGGAFGGLKDSVSFEPDQYLPYRKKGEFYCDQKFLRDVVYPQIRGSCLTVPREKHNRPELFDKEITGNFVGCELNEFDKLYARGEKARDKTWQNRRSYDDLDSLLENYSRKVTDFYKDLGPLI